MRIFSVLFLLVFLACHNDGAEGENLEAEVLRPYKLICLGSDFSIGLGLDPGVAYPALLQHQLDSMGIAATVVNASIKGETVSGAEQRIPWLLQQRVDGFFLELGAREVELDVPQEVIFEQWNSLLEKIRTAKPLADIFILTTTTAGEEWQVLTKRYELAMLQPGSDLDLSTPLAATHQQFATWFRQEYEERMHAKE